MNTPEIQPHILAVEDEEISLQFLVYHLEHAGFRVTAVTTGEEMMAVLDREQIDLVLLDLSLPDGDGLSRAQQIRETSSVPIIVVTARKGADDRLIALGLGADDFLTKPCDPRELVLRIRNVLVRGGVPCAPVRPVHPSAPHPVKAKPTPEAEPVPEKAPRDRRSSDKPKRRSLRGAIIASTVIIAVAIAAGVGQTLWWYNADTGYRLDADEYPSGPDTSQPAVNDSALQGQVQSQAQAQTPPADAEQKHEVTVTASPQAALAPPAPAADVQEGYATAARSYSWVLKSKCPPLPQGERWQIKQLTDLVRYVNREHNGEWQPYISQWVDRLTQLQAIHARGAGVKLADGKVLSGETLSTYIDETKRRLDVTLCLSREAADFAHRKSLNKR